MQTVFAGLSELDLSFSAMLEFVVDLKVPSSFWGLSAKWNVNSELPDWLSCMQLFRVGQFGVIRGEVWRLMKGEVVHVFFSIVVLLWGIHFLEPIC